MICGYQPEWWESGATITYTTLLSDWTNGWRPGGGNGSLDTLTGTYSCGTPGFYTVSFSAFIELDSSQMVEVFLFQNGEKVQASHFYSSNSQNYKMTIQGSRDIILHLGMDDTLELRTESGSRFSSALKHLTLCVSLTGWDYPTLPPYLTTAHLGNAPSERRSHFEM